MRGAFAESIARDLITANLIGHDKRSFASTVDGSVELAEDDFGLRFEVVLPRTDLSKRTFSARSKKSGATKSSRCQSTSVGELTMSTLTARKESNTSIRRVSITFRPSPSAPFREHRSALATGASKRLRSRPRPRAIATSSSRSRDERKDGTFRISGLLGCAGNLRKAVVAGGVVTSADFAKMFVRTLEIFERRFAEAVAAAEPPLDESELQRVQEILSNSAVSRTLILGKEEPAN